MARSDSIENTERVNVLSDRMRMCGVLAEAGTETESSIHVQLINAGANDFICKLAHLRQPLASAYLDAQYCVVKSVPSSAAFDWVK